MDFFMAFLIGGIICGIAQVIQDFFKLTPGHTTAIFVILGSFLDFFNFYDKLIEVGNAGALLPITSFGHSLVHAAMQGGEQMGILGLSQHIFDLTANGIVFAVVLSVIIGLLFKPKS